MQKDYLDARSAQYLARQIEAYWKARGQHVRTEVLTSTATGDQNGRGVYGSVWVVRSNMVNGYPPDSPLEPVHMAASLPRKTAPQSRPSHPLMRS